MLRGYYQFISPSSAIPDRHGIFLSCNAPFESLIDVIAAYETGFVSLQPQYQPHLTAIVIAFFTLLLYLDALRLFNGMLP